MKKNTLLLAGIFLPMVVFSQIGVNTATPEATFDIRAKNHLGAVTSKDGLLVPRVNSLGVPGSVNGQLVYLIADSGSQLKGFYYWNNTAWTPFGGASGAGDPTVDAWVNNPANTRVELGTLSDGTTTRPAGTQVIINDAGNMGIGTSAPANKLVVKGLSAQPTDTGTDATFRVDGHGQHVLDFGTLLNAPWGAHISSHDKSGTKLPLSLNPLGGNVGIGTVTPNATLDVVGDPITTSKLDGIIAPRITGNQLKAKTYTSAQTGAIVYVTSADTSPSGQTINITSAGYYYFDGSVWTLIGNQGDSVVKLSTVAILNTSTPYNSGSVWRTIVFSSTPKLDATKMSYDLSTGEFTILKSGYYQFALYVKATTTDGGGGSATTNFLNNDTAFAVNLTGHGLGTTYFAHSVNSTSFLSAGDKIKIRFAYTRQFRVEDSSLSISFLGD